MRLGPLGHAGEWVRHDLNVDDVLPKHEGYRYLTDPKGAGGS